MEYFFGLEIEALNGPFPERVWILASALPTLRWEDTLIALLTLSILFFWSRLRNQVPAALVALSISTVAAWAGMRLISGFEVATVDNAFEYSINGLAGQGIPPMLPHFVWPWELPGADGQPIGHSLGLINSLLGSAFAIAALAAIESLLCAVIADGMSGRRHNPNAELIGQGIGNICIPYFGGIPASATISRTAISIRSGAGSPFAAVFHGAVVMLAILFIADLLGHIPMASLAALLIAVAWNMAEARHFMRIVRTAPGSDVAVLLTCFSLTVLFDMTIAVAVGVALAGLLFIRQIIEQTETHLVEQREHARAYRTPDWISVYDVNGALFFGAAHKALKSLESLPRDKKVVILDMTDVTMLDITAIMLLQELINKLRRQGVAVVLNGLHPRLILDLRRGGIRKRIGVVEFSRDITEGLARAQAIYSRQQQDTGGVAAP